MNRPTLPPGVSAGSDECDVMLDMLNGEAHSRVASPDPAVVEQFTKLQNAIRSGRAVIGMVDCTHAEPWPDVLPD